MDASGERDFERLRAGLDRESTPGAVWRPSTGGAGVLHIDSSQDEWFGGRFDIAGVFHINPFQNGFVASGYSPCQKVALMANTFSGARWISAP